MRLTVQLALLTTTCFPVMSAFAADAVPSESCVGPCLIYSWSLELSAGWLNSSDNTIGNSYVLLPSSESNLLFKANDSFSVMTNIVSENVIDGEPGSNQIFSGLGTYVDVLQAQYDYENVSIWGGKIHPAFGRASDMVPGLYGSDLAESYDLSERLGGGISYGFEAGGFSNKLQASAFTVDRTILSQSLFAKRGRTQLVDGGAGNTTGVSSFSAALDGCIGADVDNCYDEGSFGYQLAARYQKGGDGSEGNELGFLGSLNKSFSLSDDAKLNLFTEAAWFRNYDGGPDNAFIVTSSAAYETGPMTYSLAYTQERMLVADGVDTTEHLLDATVMYDLEDVINFTGEKWAIGAGYSFSKVDSETEHTVGLKLTADFGGIRSFGN
jgi:hypothetical protein